MSETTTLLSESVRLQARIAASEAVRNMPGDWWCPERSNITRRDCEFCIADVAVTAALLSITAEAAS